MEKSNLIKEFDKKTVQRMRNIITGKTGDRTQVLSGWEKDSIEHTEGDIWEENGRKWTIKNGVKQTITKLDKFKHIVNMPFSCPSCGKAMKTDSINKKMYAIHKTCFDCVLKKEAKIKLEGKWEEYEKGIIKNNYKANLEDFEKALDAWYIQKDSFVSESGEVESWDGGDKNAIYEQIKEQIIKAKESDIY